MQKKKKKKKKKRTWTYSNGAFIKNYERNKERIVFFYVLHMCVYIYQY